MGHYDQETKQERQERLQLEEEMDNESMEHTDDCFVATAVYQNPVAEQVELYRWFRDNYLVKTESGKRFVEWYQSGGGQRLSEIVKEHPGLRVPSKVALDIGALAIKSLKYAKERAA